MSEPILEPFAVRVPDDVLDDLRERLARVRWPDEVEGAGWDYGVPLAALRDLVARWRDGFDWRERERRANRFAHFRAHLDGYRLHFVHARGRGPDPLPLLLVHGWPSSFLEMLDLLPLLTDPAAHGGDERDAFDVVVPSLVGFGFSDRVVRRGVPFVAFNVGLLDRLMTALGYDRFGAHAHDIGASVVTRFALERPERFVGYHTTEPGIPGPSPEPDEADLTDAERDHLAYRRRWQAEEGGYFALLGTRPQTLAYGLHDSPVALAAWLFEKWHAWTAPPGGTLDDRLRDDVLAQATLYWVTGTANSANRPYFRDAAVPPSPHPPARQLQVPMGVLLNATQPIEHAPREWVERFAPDLRRWERAPRGGHFFAGEEPERLAHALREFYRPLREARGARAGR